MMGIRWDGGGQEQNSGTTGNSERAFDFGVIDTIKPYCILWQESGLGVVNVKTQEILQTGVRKHEGGGPHPPGRCGDLGMN